MNFATYPFTALVGQDLLKTALLLNAVDPKIGGVLISGEKGTAKSTAARALAAVLPAIRRVSDCPYQCGDGADHWAACPHCLTLATPVIEESAAPFVDLPLGATEDRVLGTLDFQSALREGKRRMQPGILASAHRGILYIDEVNLLPDHLVDVLLDVASMGINTVQREGIELHHPSRFILIGSMNPEEGQLRPQLLDRFGLMVTVAASREPEVRCEIVRRRLDYDANPAWFAERFAGEQAALRQRIMQARQTLSSVQQANGILAFISQLCCEMNVDGLRADIVLLRTARALAAWDIRSAVTMDDVRAAAELVLAHRRRPAAKVSPERQPRENPKSQPAMAANSIEQSSIIPAAAPTLPPRIELAGPSNVDAAQGRRNRANSQQRGAYVRAVPDPKATDLALGPTIRAAVGRSAGTNGAVGVVPEDLHRKERSGRTGTLLLFVVDASGSMAARRRMEAVKGAVLGLLQSAYEQRDQVALLTFRGPEANLLLPPTRSRDAAEEALRSLPTGGRTPLAHALVCAHDVFERHRRSQPDVPPWLLLLTDGNANVCLPGEMGDPWQQAVAAAARLSGTPAIVFDTQAGYTQSNHPGMLASALGAECLRLEEMSAENLLHKVLLTRRVRT